MSNKNSIEIKTLTPDDFNAWLPLWKGYQSFYETDIPTEVTAVTWRRLLDPAEPMFGALALSDGAAVGMVHWIMHRSCWTIGDYCYLQDLYVDQSRRARGIGRELIDSVYAKAAEAHCSRVYWLTHETNLAAMKLYDRVADKSGFIQYRKML